MMKAAIKNILISLIVLSLCGCTATSEYYTRERVAPSVRLERVRNAVLSWPSAPDVDALKGAMLLRDGPAVTQSELAIARAILHTNPRISQAAALLLADATARAARKQQLPTEFLGATLLQESAYDPRAISAAGAIGIAQFMPETAAATGVDPFDPYDAIDGAARLLGGYAAAYAGRYGDSFAAALAAYNAGPLAVARYGGVPPYAETRQYIALIFDRWARIESYETSAWDDNAEGRKKSVK